MLFKILKIAPGHSRYCLRYKQIYFEILVDFSADQNCVNGPIFLQTIPIPAQAQKN